MAKYYCGIGSRQTPGEILEIMLLVSIKLRSQKWILRSGGADGADKAFETGAGFLKDIYYANDATPESMEIAKRYHPAHNPSPQPG